MVGFGASEVAVGAGSVRLGVGGIIGFMVRVDLGIVGDGDGIDVGVCVFSGVADWDGIAGVCMIGEQPTSITVSKIRNRLREREVLMMRIRKEIGGFIIRSPLESENLAVNRLVDHQDQGKRMAEFLRGICHPS